MITTTTWRIDATMILTRRELRTVLADLRRKAERSVNTQLNLVIFRLACCCGLRASEIAQLRLADVRVGVDRPHLQVRRCVGKGHKRRRVPLWWDAGTLADVQAWKDERERQGASADALFVCSQVTGKLGQQLTRHGLRFRFKTACKSLGRDRVRQVTIHHGRHSFISHALAGRRTLAEVRDAAGHSSVSTTSAYLHVAVDDDGEVGHLFRFEQTTDTHWARTLHLSD